MTTPSTGPSSSSGQPEPSLGALFATASRDMSTLVRSEIELAKTELRSDLKAGAAGGAMFGAAGYLGILATVLLSIALAEGLVQLGVWPWLAFLIVAVLYLLIAGLLVLIGKKKVQRLQPPERTIRTSKDTVAFLKTRKSAPPSRLTDATSPDGAASATTDAHRPTT